MSTFIATWLLPIFFLLVGAELKEEFRTGQLSKNRAYLAPATAAIFGVILPLLIFLGLTQLFNYSHSAWGTVIATDLPLALIAAQLFKRELRSKIRPYLISLAVIDDLISILLIAIFYSENGIHPTVYGFLVGILLPINLERKFFKLLSVIVNYIVLPSFIITSVFDHFTIKFGWLTLIIVLSRLVGKPTGIVFGNLVAQKIFRTKLLNSPEAFAIGTLASLGLSVSYLYVEIAHLSVIAAFAILVLIPIALIQIRLASKVFFRQR